MTNLIPGRKAQRRKVGSAKPTQGKGPRVLSKEATEYIRKQIPIPPEKQRELTVQVVHAIYLNHADSLSSELQGLLGGPENYKQLPAKTREAIYCDLNAVFRALVSIAIMTMEGMGRYIQVPDDLLRGSSDRAH